MFWFSGVVGGENVSVGNMPTVDSMRCRTRRVFRIVVADVDVVEIDFEMVVVVQVFVTILIGR